MQSWKIRVIEESNKEQSKKIEFIRNTPKLKYGIDDFIFGEDDTNISNR